MPGRLWWFAPEDRRHAEFYVHTQDWIRSLGLNPNRILSDLEMFCDDEGDGELHFEEFVLDEDGNRQIDGDSDRVLTIQRVLHVEDGSWPPRPEVSV